MAWVVCAGKAGVRELGERRRPFPPSSHGSTCLDLDKILRLWCVIERHALFKLLFVRDCLCYRAFLFLSVILHSSEMWMNSAEVLQ